MKHVLSLDAGPLLVGAVLDEVFERVSDGHALRLGEQEVVVHEHVAHVRKRSVRRVARRARGWRSSSCGVVDTC